MTLDTTTLALEGAKAPRRRRRARTTTLIAGAWLAVVVVAVVAAPLLAPGGATTQDLTIRMALPSGEHLLGTDALGRDILARILHGGRVTLTSALVGTATAMIIGVPLGLAAGYFGRWADRVLSFCADLLMAVPVLLVILLGFAIFPNNSLLSMFIFGWFASAPIFRIMRGASLTISGELYVTAARASGLSHLQVILRHVAPRLSGLIQVQAAVVGALALAMQVGLGFLGLDVAPPTASWGGMIAEAAQGLLLSMWPVAPPTLMIVLTIVALGTLGDLGQERAASRSSVSLGSPRRRRARTSAATVAPRADGAAEDGVLLRVRDLTVAVRTETGERITLVDDVSFDVGQGEVIGLVGESGAGKSVTARALLGLNGSAETTGSALFEGIDLLNVTERELRRVRGTGIAFVGQDPMSSLDPLFRVDSHLIEAVRTHQGGSRASARRRALELLEAVRIPDPATVARRFPFELSGGMAQRVSIALALAGDPRLLIADEPTTALDVTVQMEVLGLLQRLRRERGLTVILVTHDWGVIADMCDRALTMYAGEVVETGPVEDLFAEPRHPYTLALRRSDPHLQEPGAQLLTIPGAVPPPGARPAGCRFADRCEFAIDPCRAAHPPLLHLDAGRASRCIRIDEVSREVQRDRAHA